MVTNANVTFHVQAGKGCSVFLADLKSAIDLSEWRFGSCERVPDRPTYFQRCVFYGSLQQTRRPLTSQAGILHHSGGVSPPPWPRCWPCLCALILIDGEQQWLLLIRWCSFVVLPRVERCACWIQSIQLSYCCFFPWFCLVLYFCKMVLLENMGGLVFSLLYPPLVPFLEPMMN